MIVTPLVLALAASTHALLYYIGAALLVLAVLAGISLMSKVEKAVLGNIIGSVSMALAILLTLWHFGIFSIGELWAAMLVGTLIGIWISIKVKMIQMPQMVGLLNGFGGAASALTGILTLTGDLAGMTVFATITAGLAVAVGALTFTGSLVAAGKLHRVFSQKPVILRHHQLWTTLTLVFSLISVVLFAVPTFQSGALLILNLLFCTILSSLFGIIFSIRVGGADMPITISLLNSFSGVAGAIAGLAIADPLLVAVGGIVGASGLLLTQIMCRAMNRHLLDILLGKTAVPTGKTTAVQTSAEPQTKTDTTAQTEPVAEPASPADPTVTAGQWLRDARQVIIVPGYGMALSQAQPAVKQLVDQLEEQGKTVAFAIHPVAGRMPGHMNVLLAEVDIPYEQLHELDDINPQFAETDVALVIGANDVINPAANTAEGTPIYGMPILNVADTQRVIICNFDRQPGYAGVDNPLYTMETDRVQLLLGDAKATISDLIRALAEVPAAAADDASADASGKTTAVDAVSETPTDPLTSASQKLRDARQIIIVPGYGMALSQAQPAVKQLADRLEELGKSVEFAIHPVAGRMPGHMNVLLAEVDVPYEKLHEMDEINPQFAETDVVLVIGANDVINPAANSAEGTPIYGMPILNVVDARHVLICNFDRQPGYAGVNNPLYSADPSRVTLLFGDAKATIKDLNRQLLS